MAATERHENQLTSVEIVPSRSPTGGAIGRITQRELSWSKKKKKKRIEQSEQVNEDGEKNEISATTMLIYSEPLLLFVYIYTLVNVYCSV